MDPIIEKNKAAIQKICEDNNIRSLHFFGSIVDSERFSEDSDIDVLISFNEGISLDEYTDCYFRLLFALEELLDREIDITTERSIKNPYFKEELDNTKVLFFDSLSAVNG